MILAYFGGIKVSDTYMVFYAEHLRASQRPEMIRPHYHDYYEAYMFLGDEMTYFIDNHSYKLGRYDIAFIDRSTYHQTFYSDKSSKERILITYDDSLYTLTKDPGFPDKAKLLYDIRRLSLPKSIGRDLYERYFSHIAGSYSNDKNELGYIKARLLFVSLLIEAIGLAKEYSDIKDAKESLSAPQKLVMNAVDFINTNYSKRIGLDDICGACYVSKYYLCHIFRDITGTSISSFLLSKRMNEAEKLLKYSHQSIAAISDQTGFANANSFIDSFKRRHEMTPGKYRKGILKSH